MSNTDQSVPNPGSVWQRWFLDHPASVDETYLEHMRFAFGFAFWLFVAALAAALHAIVPALCKTTASDILKRLHARITSRVPQ